MLKLRIFDAAGNLISEKEVRTINLSTPEMEHIIAKVRERMMASQKMAVNDG